MTHGQGSLSVGLSQGAYLETSVLLQLQESTWKESVKCVVYPIDLCVQFNAGVFHLVFTSQMRDVKCLD